MLETPPLCGISGKPIHAISLENPIAPRRLSGHDIVPRAKWGGLGIGRIERCIFIIPAERKDLSLAGLRGEFYDLAGGGLCAQIIRLHGVQEEDTGGSGRAEKTVKSEPREAFPFGVE